MLPIVLPYIFEGLSDKIHASYPIGPGNTITNQLRFAPDRIDCPRFERVVRIEKRPRDLRRRPRTAELRRIAKNFTVMLTNYGDFDSIMAILLLETLRLSGSLARHDGVTRRCFFESAKTKLLIIGIRNCNKCDGSKEAKLGKQG